MDSLVEIQNLDNVILFVAISTKDSSMKYSVVLPVVHPVFV